MRDHTRPTWLATWGLETPETEAEREDRLRKAKEHKEFLGRCVDENLAAGISSTDLPIEGKHPLLEEMLEGTEEGKDIKAAIEDRVKHGLVGGDE